MSAHRNPTAFARRTDDCVDHLLHFPTLAKVRASHRLAGDREQVVANLDGLEIVEAQLMPGCDAERSVGCVPRACSDRAKAVAAVVHTRLIELQLVETLLREEQCAAAA